MKPLNKGAKRRTQGLLICLISFIITANFPWAPGSEPLPCARPYLPLHIAPAPRRSPRAPPGPSRRGLGEPPLPAALFARPGARRRDDGRSKGSGLAAPSLTAAFQRRAYQSRAFSEALISNLEPSPLWRGAFNLTSGIGAGAPFFLALNIYCFPALPARLPSSPPAAALSGSPPPDKAYGGRGSGGTINHSFNSLLMITFSLAPREVNLSWMLRERGEWGRSGERGPRIR